MAFSDSSSASCTSLTRRPTGPRRWLVLVLVLCAHGYALSLLMNSSPTGLPEPGAERVLQVSWLSGSGSEAQAGPSAAATSMPQPAKELAKPERSMHPPPVKRPAKAAAAKSARSTARDESAAASAAESAAAPTGSPAHAHSHGAGVQGPGASPADVGATGTQEFSAPRFDAAYLSNPPPEYPAVSREMGEEGRVFLRVQVSPQGRALEIGVHKSSGHARLDTAALEAVRRWQFIPGRMGGEPVVAHVIVPINFFLE